MTGRMSRTLLATLGLLAATLLAPTTAGAATRPVGPLSPASGALFGALVNPDRSTPSSTPAESGRAPVRVFFGHLRYEEQAGYDAVGVGHDLVARYASARPDVLGLVGTEISLGLHLNQFGRVQAPYDYGRIDALHAAPGRDIIPSVCDFVHRQGVLVSVNHPAGAACSPSKSGAPTLQKPPPTGIPAARRA